MINRVKIVFAAAIFFSAIAYGCGTDPIHRDSSEIGAHSDGKLLGRCEGCEAVFEYGEKALNSADTLPDFFQNGPKLKVSGTVYRQGGSEPAEGIVLYVYHTDQDGIYPTDGGEEGWAKRHGNLRGWMKTDEIGRYTFYTLVPGAYPGGTNPQHIHITILEPDGRYYWIDDFLFMDDPLLPESRVDRSNPRGGAGFVLEPEHENGLLSATRDIELGKNVPGY